MPPEAHFGGPNPKNHEFLPPEAHFLDPNLKNHDFLPPEAHFGGPNPKIHIFLPPEAHLGGPNPYIFRFYFIFARDSGGTMSLEASNPESYAKICEVVLYNILRDSISGSRSIRTLGPLGVGSK